MLPETIIMYCLAIIVFLFTVLALVFTAAMVVEIVRDTFRSR